MTVETLRVCSPSPDLRPVRYEVDGEVRLAVNHRPGLVSTLRWLNDVDGMPADRSSEDLGAFLMPVIHSELAAMGSDLLAEDEASFEAPGLGGSIPGVVVVVRHRHGGDVSVISVIEGVAATRLLTTRSSETKIHSLTDTSAAVSAHAALLAGISPVGASPP